ASKRARARLGRAARREVAPARVVREAHRRDGQAHRRSGGYPKHPPPPPAPPKSTQTPVRRRPPPAPPAPRAPPPPPPKTAPRRQVAVHAAATWRLILPSHRTKPVHCCAPYYDGASVTLRLSYENCSQLNLSLT